MEANDSQLLYHSSCSSCGSSDANAIYASGTAYCFSCGNWSVVDNSICNNRRNQTMRDDLLNGEAKALKARGIPANICSQYNYKIGVDNKGNSCQIATYYNKDKQPVAQKLRYKDKTFKFIGENKEALLYGQQLWASGGKKLTITEGEIDALSVAVAFDGKYPVVSIPNGAQGAKKAITKHLEWVSSFEEIYLWFDNDEPGLMALEECVSVLPLGKVKVIKHSVYKDASDVLINEGKSGIVNTFYNAELYKPEGIITPDDLLATIDEPIQVGFDWCYSKLTKLTYGRRYGEIVTIGGGVSIGKTDLVMSQIAFDLKAGRRVGTFMLEQNTKETLLRIAGKIDGEQYHLPNKTFDKNKLKETTSKLQSLLFMYDNFGNIEWEIIKDKIRYMTHNYGIKLFYIDNLTALNSHASDERRNLDSLMAEVASVAKELDIWIMLVSHLNTPKKGPSLEAGGQTEQSLFTGSRAIMRWSFLMLGIERNTIHPDPTERNKGLIRVLKDRFSGQATGHTVGFIYDNDTGMCLETDEDFDIERTNDDGDDY